MITTLAMIGVIVAFFGLMMHLIHQDEKRRWTRRQQNIPVPFERRKKNRRKGSRASYFGWVIRSQTKKFMK